MREPDQSLAKPFGEPRRLGLLLLDGFSLLSYASVVEPFRAANDLAGRELYKWVHIAVDSATARASNGAVLSTEQRMGQDADWTLLFVFAGGDPSRFKHAATFVWLRQLAARGVGIGGVSGGPYILARAGLLDGHRATVHWEHAAAFREAFPTLELENALYVIDRRRLTCAGGAAGMDLALELIEREQGHWLSSRVREWFIQTEPRPSEQPQRLSLRERYGIRHDGALRVLAAMEAAIEAPPSRTALARLAGLSVRQLERVFRAQLNESVAAVGLRIRLEQARRLLRTTGLTITDIALACGFSSGSHFARAFRSRYGHPPSGDRP